MSEDKKKTRRFPFAPHTRQRGVAAIEFGLLAIAFFTLVFGLIETARAVYLFNTLQEVTRRAAARAANSAFDQDTIDSIRSQALFADRRGNLVLGAPVTPLHLKVDYLSVRRDPDTGAVTTQVVDPRPSSPAQNYSNCLTDPYASDCIRLVRVQICKPDGAATCNAVPYKMLLPLIDLSEVTLPRATTVVPAQTLGRAFGVVP